MIKHRQRKILFFGTGMLIGFGLVALILLAFRIIDNQPSQEEKKVVAFPKINQHQDQNKISPKNGALPTRVDAANSIVAKENFTPTDIATPIINFFDSILADQSDSNHPPYLDPIGYPQVNEGEKLQLEVRATDLNQEDSVSLHAGNLPAFCSVQDYVKGNPASLLIDCQPGFQDAGININQDLRKNYSDIWITAQDNGSPQESDSRNLTITVNNKSIFSDLNSNYWASSEIEALFNHDITRGTTEDQNNPGMLFYEGEKALNRAEQITFIIRAMGLEPENPQSLASWYPLNPEDSQTWYANLSDVSPDYWAWPYIQTAYKEGITNGCQADILETEENEAKFCPDDIITRDQMVVLLIRSLGLEPENPKDPKNWPYDPKDPSTWVANFQDVPATDQPTSHGAHWAWFHIQAAVEVGIAQGVTHDEFYPTAEVNRAQMAVFLYRAFIGDINKLPLTNYQTYKMQTGLHTTYTRADYEYYPQIRDWADKARQLGYNILLFADHHLRKDFPSDDYRVNQNRFSDATPQEPFQNTHGLWWSSRGYYFYDNATQSRAEYSDRQSVSAPYSLNLITQEESDQFQYAAAYSYLDLGLDQQEVLLSFQAYPYLLTNTTENDDYLVQLVVWFKKGNEDKFILYNLSYENSPTENFEGSYNIYLEKAIKDQWNYYQVDLKSDFEKIYPNEDFKTFKIHALYPAVRSRNNAEVGAYFDNIGLKVDSWYEDYQEEMSAASDDNLLFIPTVEHFFDAPIGHYAVVGPNKYPNYQSSPDSDPSIIQEAHNNNALAMVSHPTWFENGQHTLFENMAKGDAIEMWIWSNGPQNTTIWDQLLWQYGKKVWLASTEPKSLDRLTFSLPYNVVLAEDLSASSIKNAIKKGHVYLTNAEDPYFDFYAIQGSQKMIMGDTVDASQGKVNDLKISVKYPQGIKQVKVISLAMGYEDGTNEYKVIEVNRNTYDGMIDVSGREGMFRVEVFLADGRVIYSNPIEIVR